MKSADYKLTVRDNGPVFTTALYPTQQEWKLIGEVARTIYASKQFKTVTSAEAAATVILTGREMGLPPVFSLKHIHFIENQPTLDGAGMLALLRQHHIKYTIEEGDGWAACTIERDGTAFTEKFTRQRAEQAGLLSKNNWKKYEREMLRWRAISGAVKIQCPDATGGLLLAEELGASVNAEGAVVTDETPEIPETPEALREASQPSKEPTQALPCEDTEKLGEAPADAKNGEPEDPKALAQEAHIAWGQKLAGIRTALGVEKIPSVVAERALYLLARKVDVTPTVNGDNKVHLSGLPIDDIRAVRIAATDPNRFEWAKETVRRLLKKEEMSQKQAQEDEKKDEGESESSEDIEKLSSEVKMLQEHIQKQAQGFEGARLTLKALRKAGLGTGSEVTREALEKGKANLLNAFTRISMGEAVEDVIKDFE